MSTSAQESGESVHELAPERFEHVTVESGARAECTIFPADCDDADLVTHWITAAEGAFVGLEEMA